MVGRESHGCRKRVAGLEKPLIPRLSLSGAAASTPLVLGVLCAASIAPVLLLGLSAEPFRSHHYKVLLHTVFYAVSSVLTCTALTLYVFRCTILRRDRPVHEVLLTAAVAPAFTHPVVLCAAWKLLSGNLSGRLELWIIHLLIPFFLVPFGILRLSLVPIAGVRSREAVIFLLGGETIGARIHRLWLPLSRPLLQVIGFYLALGTTIFFIPHYFGNGRGLAVAGLVYASFHSRTGLATAVAALNVILIGTAAVSLFLLYIRGRGE